MTKTMSRILALGLTAALLLTGCGGSNEETVGESGSGEASAQNKDEIKDLVYPRLATRELETFNLLYSQRLEDHETLCNLVDGLLEVDSYGKLQPGIAEKWGTEDGGLTWTFNLRDGVKWVDMNAQEKADCTAQDFATGLEWVLNFHKNDSANTSMPFEMIKGAEEYYEYTKSLSKEEAYALTAGEGSKFREMVGIATPDDHTVVYTCINPTPYFDTVGTYVCLFPMAQGMIDELGGAEAVKSMNNETMWYNGCYTMTSYIQGNEKVLEKNPMYWDKECSLFDTVTIKMVESADIAFQLYQSGEVDYCDLTESNIKTISENEGHEFHDYMVPGVASKYSFQYHFNFNKKKPDGTVDTNWNTAIANEAFRRSWYYGLDLTDLWKRSDAINPMNSENNFYTMKGLVYTSDGTEYTELVAKELGLEINGKTPARLNKEKAEQYKKQAMEELSALGVTFPVVVDHYIPASSQTALDGANVLKQIFSQSLGDDYVVLNINTYVSKLNSEVIQPHLHSILNNGWGADYGDPQNYLGQETYGTPQAYYSENYSYINEITEETPENKALLDTYKEYTKLVEEANAIIDDMDARYKAYAKAEAFLLDHALVLPVNYQQGWCLSRIDNTSRMNAMFGIQNEKMKNWRTNKDGYTTEQAQTLASEHAAAKKA